MGRGCGCGCWAWCMGDVFWVLGCVFCRCVRFREVWVYYLIHYIRNRCVGLVKMDVWVH